VIAVGIEIAAVQMPLKSKLPSSGSTLVDCPQNWRSRGAGVDLLKMIELVSGCHCQSVPHKEKPLLPRRRGQQTGTWARLAIGVAMGNSRGPTRPGLRDGAVMVGPIASEAQSKQRRAIVEVRVRSRQGPGPIIKNELRPRLITVPGRAAPRISRVVG